MASLDWMGSWDWTGSWDWMASLDWMGSCNWMGSWDWMASWGGKVAVGAGGNAPSKGQEVRAPPPCAHSGKCSLVLGFALSERSVAS
eukprot:6184638-Pleurochrysis_carterae.AAC.5